MKERLIQILKMYFDSSVSKEEYNKEVNRFIDVVAEEYELPRKVAVTVVLELIQENIGLLEEA